jgi:hypothetical protein
MSLSLGSEGGIKSPIIVMIVDISKVPEKK